MIRTYVIAVGTPGTPVNVYDAIVALSSGAKVPQFSGGLAGPVDLRIKGVMFQADPGNTASKNLYVGSSDLSVSSKIGIGLALLPGVVSPWISFEDSNASLRELWYDVDTAATVKNLFVTVVM